MRILFRIAMVLLLTVGARADTFNFSFVTRTSTLSGVLYGYPLSPGVYQVTGMTGAFVPGKEPPLNEVGLFPPGEFGYIYADNLLFTSEPHVDSFGINFFENNGLIFDMVHDEFGYALLRCDSNCSRTNLSRTPGVLEVSFVPEPPSLLLMASGITLLGTQTKRIRFKRA